MYVVYVNNLVHMIKMAAMPIYGKKPFKNLPSAKPVDQF